MKTAIVYAGCKCNYAEAGNTGCPVIKENKQ